VLGVSPANVVLSALKVSEDGEAAVLRIYEAAGQATEAEITLPGEVTRAEDSDLMETPGAELPLEGGKLRLTLRPFEIRTIRFRRI
jgi:alpha-mannosidase